MEYVLLDARAHHDPDSAVVYVWCKDLREALDYRGDFPDAVLAECQSGGPLVVVAWPAERDCGRGGA